MLSHIIGQNQPLQTIRRAVVTGRIPNAFLFVGPPNVGKELVALELAKVLNCERLDSEAELIDCCDECGPCRAIGQVNYPDMMLVRATSVVEMEDGEEEKPEANGAAAPEAAGSAEIEGQMIKTDQIESLVNHSMVRRVSGRRKVYIISNAQAMNKSAENRLLKTLEEPPADTVLILTTPNLGALLPTTISRCQVVRFTPVPASEAEARLRERFPQVPAEQLRSLVAMSAGRPGWAITMLRHPEVLATRAQLLDLCAALPGSQLVTALQTGERLLDAAERWWLAMAPEEVGEKALKSHRDRVLRMRMQEVLEVLISWFRDLMILHADPQATTTVNFDRLDDLRRLAPRYSVDTCRRVCAYLEDMKPQLRQNANLRMAAEVIALRIINASAAAA